LVSYTTKQLVSGTRECGSGNAECGKYEHPKFGLFLFHIPHSEFHIHSMLLLAIFIVSFSTLAFEVLLTRVFAIAQWNHLSFMVISIALFGFGASGTLLSLLNVVRVPRRWHWADPGIGQTRCRFQFFCSFFRSVP